MKKVNFDWMAAIFVASAASSASTSAFMQWVVEPGKEITFLENILLLAATVGLYVIVIGCCFYLLLPAQRRTMRNLVVNSRFFPGRLLARVWERIPAMFKLLKQDKV